MEIIAILIQHGRVLLVASIVLYLVVRKAVRDALVEREENRK